MEESITLSLSTAGATRQLGQLLGRSLPPGSVLLLQGDLGSGKTTLVQGMGEGLGIQDTIDSPTFTLINEYFEGRVPLYHLDLYRLDPNEVRSLFLETYWDSLENPPGIVVIEWAERLTERPSEYLQICLAYDSHEGRSAQLKRVGLGQISLSDMANALVQSPVPTNGVLKIAD